LILCEIDCEKVVETLKRRGQTQKLQNKVSSTQTPWPGFAAKM
jgi:hypothetical protein